MRFVTTTARWSLPTERPALQNVRTLGGTIESTSSECRSIIAWIPLNKLERLTAHPVVQENGMRSTR